MGRDCSLPEIKIWQSGLGLSSLVMVVIREYSVHTHTQPFNGPFSRTTRLSQYQKGKTNQNQITMPAPHHSVIGKSKLFQLLLQGSKNGKYYDSYFLCHSFYPRDAMLVQVLAMALCLCLSVSACHKSVFCRNGWVNWPGFWPGSFLPPILHYVERKFV